MATATSETQPQSETTRNHAAFIWSVADLLRGDYKQSEYGKVILPLTVIRRLDCVLEPTKQAVLETAQAARRQDRERRAGPPGGGGAAVLQHLAADFTQAARRSRTRSPTRCSSTSAGFSEAARDVIDKFDFGIQIDRLRQGQPALPGGRQVRRDRPAPRRGVEHRDGLPLRGADPQVLRAVERDRRRALHAARGDPADGEPAVHRRRRRPHQARHRQDALRPGLRHRRDAVGRRGPPARA